jgi:hypothetical protein
MKETITEGLSSARRKLSQLNQAELYRIDIEQVAKELDLENEARKLAAAGLPPPDQTSLSAPEAKAVQRVEKARHDFVDWASTRVTTINEGLARRDVTVLVNEALLAHRRFERAAGAALAEHESLLEDLAENAEQRERELADFRERHAITRPATYPEGSATFARYAILLALIVFEGAANAYFFSQGLESGLIGGFLAAGLFAAVNLVSAFVLGKYAVPLVFHRTPAVKALGIAAAAFAVFCMIAIGLSIGHFRDALIADAAEPARAASLALKAAPFALRDVMSWLLFAVSVLFAVFALFDGLSSDDRYPGYGEVARRARQSRDDYLGELQGVRKILEDLKQDELEMLERNMQKARTYITESTALLRDKNWVRTRLEAALLDAENCLDTLLKIVRDTNRMHRRGVPTPGYFEARPALQTLGIPDFGTNEDRARFAAHERLVEQLLAEADGIGTVIEETFNTYAARLKPGYRARHRAAAAHAQK